jgi:hypothetical protein
MMRWVEDEAGVERCDGYVCDRDDPSCRERAVSRVFGL